MGPWSPSPDSHHDGVLLRSRQLVGFGALRLQLGWAMEAPLLSSRGKALTAESGGKLPCLSIMVVVIMDLTLSPHWCSRLPLLHPTGRGPWMKGGGVGDTQGDFHEVCKWGRISSLPRINTERAKRARRGPRGKQDA